jgi:sugar/nucleoside kinase (ribokinase family)
MDNRTTHAVAVNVLEAYDPKLPEHYRDSEVVVLANMSPRNQLDVLGQCDSANFVVADTMDIWIQAERKDLLELLAKINLLVINESEAKLFMETTNLVKAGRQLLGLGPANVIVKTGEHGAMLFGRGEHDFFRTGAFPLEHVEDPTGAGDCFVGGLAGHLASTGRAEPTFDDLKRAIARGTVVASYNCESFSVEGLVDLSDQQIATRLDHFHRYTQF